MLNVYKVSNYRLQASHLFEPQVVKLSTYERKWKDESCFLSKWCFDNASRGIQCGKDAEEGRNNWKAFWQGLELGCEQDGD